jgi:septal ring factor EnvC (AmiA/AmiB activator)
MVSYETLLFVTLIVLTVAVIGLQLFLMKSRVASSWETRRIIYYLLIVLMLLLQVTAWFYFKAKKESTAELKPDIQVQIEQLDRFEDSLLGLKSFIEAQRNNLKESEERIESLNKERDKLQPIVEADRKAIEAIFQVQDERNRQSVWIERIGAAPVFLDTELG